MTMRIHISTCNKGRRCCFLLVLLVALCSSSHGQTLRRPSRLLEEESMAPSSSPTSSPSEDNSTSPLRHETNSIIGGTPVNPGAFPWFVKFEGNTLCGGSLISPNRVLTAGHCIDRGPPPTVRVGTTNGADGVQVGVRCAVRHPQYSLTSDTVLNDIAILKLDRNVFAEELAADSNNNTALSRGIQRVQINRNANYPSQNGFALTVIGFGRTSPNGDLSNKLLQVGTSFVSLPTCQGTYPGNVIKDSSHLCADVQNKGDCNGDSGGPLFDGNGVQVGIVSFGYGGCASNAYQDVYTKVSAFQGWIDQHIGENKCPAPGSSGGGSTGGGGGGGGGGCGSFAVRVSTFFRNTFTAVNSRVFGG